MAVVISLATQKYGKEGSEVADWRQRHKRELRQRLFETALARFESDGYENTTVLQITEQVGVAKGTFFNHFPTKEHVVAEWYDGITARSLEVARGRTHPTAEDAVCDLFSNMAREATTTPALLVAKASNSAHPLLIDAEQRQVEEINAYLSELCALGKERGELDANLDVAFFVDLLGAVLTGSSRAWVRAEPRFDFPAAIRARVRFLFRGAKVASPRRGA